MSRGKKTYRTLLIGTIFIFFVVPWALSATVEEVAQGLTCICGCNMLVSACEATMECGPAADIKNQIVAKLESGQSKEEIIAFFVDRYGESILSSPTKRGFNLVAWILPFAAVIFGIGTLYVLLKSWAPRKKPGDQQQVPFKQEDKIYLDKIERELNTFES